MREGAKCPNCKDGRIYTTNQKGLLWSYNHTEMIVESDLFAKSCNKCDTILITQQLCDDEERIIGEQYSRMKKRLQWIVLEDGTIEQVIDACNIPGYFDIYDTYVDAINASIEAMEEEKELLIEAMADMREQIYRLDAKIKELKLNDNK